MTIKEVMEAGLLKIKQPDWKRGHFIRLKRDKERKYSPYCEIYQKGKKVKTYPMWRLKGFKWVKA